MNMPVTVAVEEGQTTYASMANWVRFVWHINEVCPDLIISPLDDGLRSITTAEGVEYEEEYDEVLIIVRKTTGTVTFQAKSDRAGQALLTAFDTWEGGK